MLPVPSPIVELWREVGKDRSLTTSALAGVTVAVSVELGAIPRAVGGDVANSVCLGLTAVGIRAIGIGGDARAMATAAIAGATSRRVMNLIVTARDVT